MPRMDGWFYVEKSFGIAKGVAGKLAASGTKVGGKRYRDAIAMTNDAYCRCLAERTQSKIPKNVKCVHEVIIHGLRMEDVRKAVKAGIEKARNHGGLKDNHSKLWWNTRQGRIYLDKLFA